MILVEAEKNVAVHSQLREERVALDRIQHSTSLAELLKITADEVMNITGLDRVMIYRFHDDLHGEVLAESVKTGVESYLGLHYPASDIPVPARAVFLKNWVRMIPDVGYQPVALVTHEGAPLDLGKSLLRAVSPIHIEYLKNMGVGASLTISLISNGKLWGLIACHALKPKYVSLPARDACETIGRITSALITSKIELEKNNLRGESDTVVKELVSRLNEETDLAVALTDPSPNILHLISAAGASAALYRQGYWASAGKTPTEEQMNSLVSWLEANHLGEPIFATNSLAKEFPEAKDYLQVPCGVLALAIPKSPHNYLIWFRPEINSKVKWAGKPEKMVAKDGSLHPRTSFQEWEETVDGKSEPWTVLEKELALELRNSILAVELSRQFQKEQEARKAAERAMLLREEMMAVLSHDLKNPLSAIQLSTKVAEKFLESESKERVAEVLSRITRATSNMNHLINDVLSIAKLESGSVELDHETAEITEVISEVVEILEPIAIEKKIVITKRFLQNSCNVRCDRGRLIQVLSNILGNAIKFTPESGKICVDLESCGPEFLRISVTDTGPGINVDHLDFVFDRFWQANQAKRLGTGLGLAIAKGIISAHGGEIWAESDGKSFTTFRFTLPL
jgi:chemotaxis family two-component system sensor kinase Cph1